MVISGRITRISGQDLPLMTLAACRKASSGGRKPWLRMHIGSAVMIPIIKAHARTEIAGQLLNVNVSRALLGACIFTLSARIKNKTGVTSFEYKTPKHREAPELALWQNLC